MDVRYKSKTKTVGKALLHYVSPPPFNWPYYYQVSHSNKLAAALMVDGLQELGFDVTNTNFMRPTSHLGADFDLYIGHGTKFYDVGSSLPSQCKKILLLTGSAPEFGNSAQLARAEYFHARHGTSILPHQDNIVPTHLRNLELCDFAILMGNEYTKQTYPTEFHKKIVLINNVTPFAPHYPSHRNETFLFMSSVGQVHRGLDIVLDVFAKRTENLLVCSDYESESDFFNYYQNTLQNQENITARGFIKTSEHSLSKICSESSYCALPSCSEGQSSSLINMISKGLLPIYTPYCGLPFHDLGICLESCTIESFSSAIDKLIGLSDKEYFESCRELTEKSKVFQPESFKKHFKSTIALGL